MAKNIDNGPADAGDDKEAFAALVRAKMAAGLTEAQAIECAKAQVEHDKSLAAREAKASKK